MSDYRINITWLYPELLNLHGDKGNIECLRKRLEWRDIEAEVTLINSQDKLDIKSADIIFLGGGGSRETEIVQKNLTEYKDELKTFVENGGTLIAFCSGYHLLGKSYLLNGKTAEGLGVLDIYTEGEKESSRHMGNAVIECKDIATKIVGFENHSEKVKIGNYEPFGKVIKGFGNDGESGFEGVSYKNLIGTHLHGPLLPKNPQLCDRILMGALKHKYPDFNTLLPLDDTIEIQANEYMQNRS